MHKPDNLYLLIKSLAPSEKRHFKLYTAKYTAAGGKKYVRLFDALAKLKHYDKDSLSAFFEKENLTGQIAVVKNYLFNLILRSLRDYHNRTHTGFAAYGALEQAAILHDKGLSAQALKLVKKALQQSLEAEKFLQALEALELRVKIITSAGRNDAEVARMIQERESIQQQRQVKEYYETMYLKRDTSAVPFEKHSGFREEREHMPVSARLLRNDLLAAVLIKQRAFKKALSRLLDNKLLLKKHPGAAMGLPESFQIHLHVSQCRIYLATCDYRNFHEQLRTLHALEVRPYQARLLKKVHYRCLLLEYHVAARIPCDVKNVIGNAKEMTECGLSGSSSANLVARCYYYAAYLLFINEDYTGAVGYLNKIIGSSACKADEAIIVTSRILALIAHFEMGRYGLLSYMHRLTVNFMQKCKALYEFEIVFVNYMRTVKKFEHPGKEMDFYASLHRKLKNLYDPDAPQLFDYLSWAESKMKREKFSAAFRRNKSV